MRERLEIVYNQMELPTLLSFRLFNTPSLALLVHITSTCLNVEAVTRTEELWSKSLFDMLYKTLLVCKSDVLCIPPLLSLWF